MNPTRVDRKYLLADEAVSELLDAKPELWASEAIAGRTIQRYETEYFDTPELTLFHAARLQRASRAKVRVRHYLDTGDTFLEVKSRNARGEITKVRQPWSGSLTDARPFLEAALGPLAACGDPVRPDAVTIDRLVPMARTAYQRTAMALTAGGRMTVDRHLAVGPHRGVSHHLIDDRFALVILETKSPNQSPTGIDRGLWDAHTRPMSLSKYALAIASFRPDLPVNRWARAAAYLHPLP